MGFLVVAMLACKIKMSLCHLIEVVDRDAYLIIYILKTTLLIKTNLCQAGHINDWHVLIHFHPPIIFIISGHIIKRARPKLCNIFHVGVLDDHKLLLMYNIYAIMDVYVVEYDACLPTKSS